MRFGLQACNIFCQLVRDRAIEHLETWALGGANFNVQDYDKRTPLHIAADEELSDAVAVLLKHGATPQMDRWQHVPAV